MPGSEPGASAAARRRAVAVAGHAGDEGAARAGLGDEHAQVRAGALGALARMGALHVGDLRQGLGDEAVEVRRRACELAGRLGTAEVEDGLVVCLADGAPAVAEAASYALGELGALSVGAVDALSSVASTHQDPLCREAAVAALGAVGHPDGLAAVLGALDDKVGVRRRAVIALAGFEASFEGEQVQSALRRAAHDRDWQVRQGAEDMLGQRPRPGSAGPAPTGGR